MSSRELVHQLLFQALLDLRQRGSDSSDSVVFHLSDLFHNAVLQLERASEAGSSEDYDAILTFLKRRAAEKGCDEWIQQQLALLETKAAAG